MTCGGPASEAVAQEDARPFGDEFPRLDSMAVGSWWERPEPRPNQKKKKNSPAKPFIEMDVPRDQVVAFAVYTHDQGVLKLTAQLFPLRPDEERVVRLELERNGRWRQVSQQPVLYPGWNCAFSRQKLG